MTELNRCARNTRCQNRQKTGDTHIGVVCDRALCDDDLTLLATTIRDLPHLYVQLAQRIPPGTVGKAEIRGTTGQRLVPVDTGILALMSRIALTLTTWEGVVRDVAGDGDVATGVREGTAVFTAASYLAVRVSALCALGATTVGRWDTTTTMTKTGGDFVRFDDLDGADAVEEIFTLWHHVVRALGLGTVTELLSEPCWTCRVKALVVETGSDTIRCTACGAKISRDEHAASVYRAAHMTGRLA